MESPFFGGSTNSLISADRVEGTEVFNAAGEHLGEVQDVIIDKQTGKVAYAIMAFGGFLGIGEKYHPLPWSMLKYDSGKRGFVVPLDEATLAKAPAYGADEFRFDDRAWNRDVHDYYKIPPYWL